MSKKVKRAEKQAKCLRRTLEKLERGRMGFTQQRDMPALHCERIIALLRERRKGEP